VTPIPNPSIEGFVDKLRALPPNLSEAKVLRRELCIYTDDSISIYFTPVADPNPKGRILFVGLTPGRFQHWQATMVAAAALRVGASPQEAALAARIGAFAGTMRMNMVKMFNGIGLNPALDIKTTASLFMTDSDLQASTSAIRHCVIRTASRKSYSGSPSIEKHPVPARPVPFGARGFRHC
jgi:hypothetical protein